MQDGSVTKVAVKCRDSPAGKPVSAVATRRVPAQPLASRLGARDTPHVLADHLLRDPPVYAPEPHILEAPHEAEGDAELLPVVAALSDGVASRQRADPRHGDAQRGAVQGVAK